MSASNFCCTHSQQRIDSPEPPPRPLGTIDGIFAAAVLAEDHPHALKIPDRKAETATAIVQSPSITSKIRLQFRRKSMRTLSEAKEYDDDARQMTLQEVLRDIEELNKQSDQHSRQSAPPSFDGTSHAAAENLVAAPADRSLPAKMDPSQPLLTCRLPELQLDNEPYDISRAISDVGLGWQLTGVSAGMCPTTSGQPKSLSAPALPLVERILPMSLRRSQSSFDVGNSHGIPVRLMRPGLKGAHQTLIRHLHLDADSKVEQTSELQSPIVHPRCNNGGEKPVDSLVCKVNDLIQNSGCEANHHAPENNGVHLHSMDISQQLRSMSQMSDATDARAALSPSPLRSFHHRERSSVSSAMVRSRHSRQALSSGMDSTTIPISWGRVHTPVRDTASSVYSRSASAAANVSALDGEDYADTSRRLSNDLNALFADWPLRNTTLPEESPKAASREADGDHGCHKSLTPSPEESRKRSESASFMTTPKDGERLSVRFLSPLGHAQSIPSKSSSSTLTKDSKRSRFLERFSPPKKTVKKRRSIFKFLRAGSRKQQTRSISSPALNVGTFRSAAAFDGPSEDPALLTVQYELVENPNHMTRSASMSHLDQQQIQGTASYSDAHHGLQRRPTLADYERNLSVIGDDRRRPSAVNVQRVKEIQEDDRRESTGLRRRLSRARPLKDDANPLMEQALEKHQQEKALFRSASKHRDSIKETHHAPVFGSSPFNRPVSSLPPPSLHEHNDLLDPLEKGQLISPSERGLDFTHLQPPDARITSSSFRSSPSASTRVPSSKPSFAGPNVETSAPSTAKARIGTSLDSWSRYPSHTRAERCGSAGRADAVLTRDFAIDVNPEEVQGSDEAEEKSPQRKHLEKQPKWYADYPRSSIRSKALSGIVRYYSNLLTTTGWHGQNRRTSVTTGGRLEYPELEMLPPQISTEHQQSDYFAHLREHVKEDADRFRGFVKEEESKLEGYVKKEEDKLEGFVRTEEHKLEEFVKKEESKLKELVKEEEDRFKQDRRHGSNEHNNHPASSPLRSGSIFGPPGQRGGDDLKRSETMIAPDETFRQDADSQSHTDAGLRLDGVATAQNEGKRNSMSKAEIWSGLYIECVTRPMSTDLHEPIKDSTAMNEAKMMPPPSLKAVKNRTPEKPKALDPRSTIRRFPSVTVIDDRKGHLRSVSLISVKTSRSQGFERASTQDLLELIQAREREEREKLLCSLDVGEHFEANSGVHKATS